MRHHDRGSIQNRRCIDGALAHQEVPHRFARRDLDGVNPAVAEPRNQEARSIDAGDNGLRIIRVEGPSAGRADPDGLAGALVERHKANRAVRLLAPGGTGRADDHQITIHHRRYRAPAMRGEQIEFLVERALP